MNSRLSLEVIDVRTPCPADWEQMAGDERTRFCQGCQKHVHNLSAMMADEAERLVCQNAGRLCIRFERDVAGRVVTLDYGGAARPKWSWRLWTVLALAAALITGTVQALLYGNRIKTGRGVVMGMMPRMIIPTPGGGVAAGGSVVQGDTMLPIDDTPTAPPVATTRPAQ
jgi:hypothetical protein